MTAAKAPTHLPFTSVSFRVIKALFPPSLRDEVPVYDRAGLVAYATASYTHAMARTGPGALVLAGAVGSVCVVAENIGLTTGLLFGDYAFTPLVRLPSKHLLLPRNVPVCRVCYVV